MLIFFWFWYFLTLILIWLCFDFWILNISKDWIFMIMLILFLNSKPIYYLITFVYILIYFPHDGFFYYFYSFDIWLFYEMPAKGQIILFLFLFRLNILLNMLLIWLHPLEHDLTYYYYFFYIYFFIEQNLDFLFVIDFNFM